MITDLLTLHNQIKVLHWNTLAYSEHVAFDKTHGELSGLIDKFIEVFIGKYGRIKSKNGFKIELDDYTTTEAAVQFIDNTISFLSFELPKKLNVDKDTDLCNIRDEMLAALNQLKYLLTLK